MEDKLIEAIIMGVLDLVGRVLRYFNQKVSDLETQLSQAQAEIERLNGLIGNEATLREELRLIQEQLENVVPPDFV